VRGIENLNLSGRCVELGSAWFAGTGILSCIAPSSGTIASVVSMTSMCGTLPKYRSAAARHGLPDWRHFPAEECGNFGTHTHGRVADLEERQWRPIGNDTSCCSERSRIVFGMKRAT
jgi:hypothetical protein